MGEKLEMLPERIFSKIIKLDSGCWIWTACKGRKNYGHILWKGKVRVAHRVVYEILKEKIKEGLVLDHLCRVHDCVNPDHLEAVTLKENINRGLTGINQKIKTHCPKGHLYSEENIYRAKRGDRQCRTCIRERSKNRRKKYGICS